MVKADVDQWKRMHASTVTFQAAAYIRSANISLAKISHMVTESRDTEIDSIILHIKGCGYKQEKRMGVINVVNLQ